MMTESIGAFRRTQAGLALLAVSLLAGAEMARAVGTNDLAGSVRTASPPPGYGLVWSDEFDGSALDTNKWMYRTDSKHWSTQRPENVQVTNGVLRLVLRKEVAGNKDYTGAGVISRPSFRYGYYEARFKVPSTKGWHTSFWLMWHDGLGGTDPQATKQEIDICENDSNRPTRYGLVVHRWRPEPHKGFGHLLVTTPDLSADFHVWGCEFTPEAVTFYFDNELKQTVDATQFSHSDQHIWLTSIASHLGGTDKVDDAGLPTFAEFDWVRYYGKKK